MLPKRRPRAAAFAIWALMQVATGCGYVQDGEWADDPGNWERAFGEPAPADIRVVRSFCWRYPHLTYEGGYYFKIGATQDWIQRVVANPDLVKIKAEDAPVPGPCANRPGWFTVGDYRAFDVYAWRGNDSAHQRISIDRKSREVFLSGCQW